MGDTLVSGGSDMFLLSWQVAPKGMLQTSEGVLGLFQRVAFLREGLLKQVLAHESER